MMTEEARREGYEKVRWLRFRASELHAEADECERAADDLLRYLNRAYHDAARQAEVEWTP
jgi:hypothetical protein